MKKVLSFTLGLYLLFTSIPMISSYAEEENSVNDPLYQYQWSHEATNIKAFWENGVTGEGVKIGVIDTGINREHSAFNGVTIETGINACAYVAGDTENLYDTTDKDGHGTAVTSIICATINDGIGMVGLTDKVTIVPYKINDTKYPSYINGAALYKAIELAYNDGCDIINISQGSPEDHTLRDKLIDEVTKKGMIIIAAAGNSGYGSSPIEYPAAYKNVIGVGGVIPDGCETIKIVKKEATGEILGLDEDVINTFHDGYSETYDLYLSDIMILEQYTVEGVSQLPKNSYKRWEMSTANESVFVSAPSDFLCDAYYKDNNRYNTTTGGTSSATPFVVAAAAGVKQLRPKTTFKEFKKILRETSIDLDEPGYDINTGWGMIDYEAIYNYVINMSDPVNINIATDENISVICKDCEYNPNSDLNKSVPSLSYVDADDEAITELEEGYDYEIIRYENYENAGTATVVVRGIEEHGYTGERHINYTVTPRDMSQRKNIIVKIKNLLQTYTGDAITPEFLLLYSDNSECELVEGVDYTVEYINNVNPGIATIKITGIGNYGAENAESIEADFKILDKNNLLNPTPSPSETPKPTEEPIPTPSDVPEPTEANMVYDEDTNKIVITPYGTDNAVLIMAEYENNILVGIEIKPLVFVDNTSIEISIESGIKYMMWKDFASMSPLCPAIEK